MNDRKNGAAYTPNMDLPADRRRGRRGIVALVLTLLLPPLGILFLWRQGVFRVRGRLLMTIVATLEMTLLCLLLIPDVQLQADLPVPITPAAATVAPDDGVVTALSNIDQLLAAQQAAEGGDETQPEATQDADEAALAAQQAAIANTTVYSVYSNAKFYHRDTVCGTQSNRRELTVGEATAEGLGACPNCNPPVYTGNLP